MDRRTMMTIFDCITDRHNPMLLITALLICGAGSWSVLRLFDRAIATTGSQRLGWMFLTAFATSAAIWCTHFVAMLAYQPGVPVAFDPVMTIVSLLVAIAGAFLALVIATGRSATFSPPLGGAILGLAISSMHYTGMIAYRVRGVIALDFNYLLVSILLAVLLGATAIAIAARAQTRRGRVSAALVMMACIVGLHITGMTAFGVTPLDVDGVYSDPQSLWSLGMAITAVACLIICVGWAIFLVDAGARAETGATLRQIELRDAMTGLPNRASFNAHLDWEIDHASESGGQFALIAFDVKRFKEVNARHGHSAGDFVLATISRRISMELRGDEFVARLAGDEFAAILRLGPDLGPCDFISRLSGALREPIPLSTGDVTLNASIGISHYPADATEAGELFRNAGLAMYQAKSDPTGTPCYYDPVLNESAQARAKLIADLSAALTEGGLSLNYQSQIDVKSSAVIGFEALLRWNHPQRGPIPPSEFIPLAEESGLVLDLGEWVLREACATAARWNLPYRIAVNLSPVQFKHPDLPKLVSDILNETGLAPERLELELTETAIIEDKAQSQSVMNRIKALGVIFALDDFGTGYSSFDTLRSYPFDRIKLDKSFVMEIESNPRTFAIVRAIVALSRGFNLPVLAEGVENAAQLEMLRAEGCDEVQGFYLGRPATIESLVSSGVLSDGREETRLRA